jgi:hypothetical protein
LLERTHSHGRAWSPGDLEQTEPWLIAKPVPVTHVPLGSLFDCGTFKFSGAIIWKSACRDSPSSDQLFS